MNEIKCPKCGTIFQINETDYVSIVKQIRDHEFERELSRLEQEHKKDKEKSIQVYESPNNLFIGAWDGKNLIGMADISKKQANHPYSGRVASTATTMLEQYTSNGLGTKFKQIVEKWARENNVHVLQSGVRHKNVRSLGNLLKQGYEIVGIFHDTAFINGEWHHEYLLEKILEK